MYEITFITLDEEKNNLVKKILEDHKAKINLELSLGKKTFAYPIKKEKVGYYTTFYFDVAGKELVSINKTLQAEKDVLRFLLIKSEQKVEDVKAYLANEKKEQVAAEHKASEVTDEAVVEETKQENEVEEAEEVKKETKKTVKKAATKKVAETKKPVAKKASAVKKAKTTKKEPESQDRIKKLEEKLDELLKD